ncbi:MIP/aquaporin family protein [Clostridium merdae]|uniref:MIP/aquaporin family protein n=1 Tax=Clostridium merdae TaxID=1958780 RepID=UPI000A26E057|nr:MIP/aquaporin family protein [Clostridium merdae]
MQNYLYEFLGTALLVLLGDAVVANVILNKTKGQNSGWVVITLGWACAVLIPALIFTASGAVFNPALVLGLAAIGKLSWSVVPGYIVAEMVGGFVGAILVWVMYKDHFDATDDGSTKLGVFCTGPAIRNYTNNFISEVIATFVLVFAILGIAQTPVNGVAAMGTFGVGAIIFACGASLGGTTGYAMNPARDLGPRLAHAILPIKDKRDSDWSYSWIPVVGPICGGLLGAWLAAAIF